MGFNLVNSLTLVSEKDGVQAVLLDYGKEFAPESSVCWYVLVLSLFEANQRCDASCLQKRR